MKTAQYIPIQLMQLQETLSGCSSLSFVSVAIAHRVVIFFTVVLLCLHEPP